MAALQEQKPTIAARRWAGDSALAGFRLRRFVELALHVVRQRATLTG
jgi:hypothetical protein